MDTLKRLFAPRYYYGSAEKMMESLGRFLEGAKVVCARRRMPVSSSSWSPTVPLPVAVETPLSEGLPVDTLADEESEALKLARPFLLNSRMQLIDIGERESGFGSSAKRADIRKSGYGGEGTERERGEEEGWRDWVTDDVARYIVQEELYLPRVDAKGVHTLW